MTLKSPFSSLPKLSNNTISKWHHACLPMGYEYIHGITDLSDGAYLL